MTASHTVATKQQVSELADGAWLVQEAITLLLRCTVTLFLGLCFRSCSLYKRTRIFFL